MSRHAHLRERLLWKEAEAAPVANSMMNAGLAEIAASAVPPHEREKRNLDVTLPARDGWQVCFFYDRGEFGYLDHFVSPDGEVIVPWSMLDGDERAYLRYWSPPLPVASMWVKLSD